ncbi:hypothetical protein [Paenibacillus sp. Soil522]|uniref:hypothetical protein n=1 Tax=Paenibacillus sp. Soil522 TaxID=1736388 RepID=UPI000AAC7265|nr:hypothetical protein [Paenibacillus sp. Soil522]
MKIWVARGNDTLRTIANEHHMPLGELQSVNLHIGHPDQNIAGKPVYFPPVNVSVESRAPDLPTCSIPSDVIEHWMPLTPLEQMAETEYDVLIVGTGAGGGTALWRL